MRSRLFHANSASDCSRCSKFRLQFCWSFSAIYRRICEMFSALLRHSVLQQTAKRASKSMHNWRRYHSWNWYEIDQIIRFWILRSVSGAVWRRREKPQHRCTIAVHLVYNCWERCRKIYLLKDFRCAQTCSLRAVVCATCTNFGNYIKRYVSSWGWNFIQVHIYSPTPNLLQ